MCKHRVSGRHASQLNHREAAGRHGSNPGGGCCARRSRSAHCRRAPSARASLHALLQMPRSPHPRPAFQAPKRTRGWKSGVETTVSMCPSATAQSPHLTGSTPGLSYEQPSLGDVDDARAKLDHEPSVGVGEHVGLRKHPPRLQHSISAAPATRGRQA
jgi:hypothetical protein